MQILLCINLEGTVPGMFLNIHSRVTTRVKISIDELLCKMSIKLIPEAKLALMNSC